MRSFCPALAVVLVLLFTPACHKKRAPTPLVASEWKGSMVYLNQRYPFSLTIARVEPDGTFTGTLSWPEQQHASPIRGTADGVHLLITDEDDDVKDVRLEGTSMVGTDKGGAATFEATMAQ